MHVSLRALAALVLLSSATAFDFDDEEVAPSGQPSAFFNDDEDTGLSVQLSHLFGDAAPKPRSKLFLKPTKGAERSGGKVAVRVGLARLDGADVGAVEALAKAGGFYTLQLPSLLSDPDSPPVSASVSACALVASRFEEHLQLTMSSKEHVLALSYAVPVVPPRCPTDGLPRLVLDEVMFNTSAAQHFPTEGPRPLGKVHDAAHLPPVAAAAARAAMGAQGVGTDGKDGAPPPEQNQSFLRKYWMYILPVVLIMSMGGAEEPQGGEGGEGGGARPAARARK
jgi:hypothetical protein